MTALRDFSFSGSSLWRAGMGNQGGAKRGTDWPEMLTACASWCKELHHVRHAHQFAGSRISSRMASQAASNSGDSCTLQASRSSSSWASVVTPMMVLATRQLR